LIDDVVAYIHLNNGNFAGPGFSVYHTECEETQTDIEVGAAFPIEGSLLEDESVKVYDLPGGSMACVVHHGSFEGLQGAYEALGYWIESNGYLIVGPTREVYLQYHPDEDPRNFVTEIQFPIKKA
jgi:effector-binding domain-containing protein